MNMPCRLILLLIIFNPDYFVHGSDVRKNVLFVVVDDLRSALGCYGDKSALTPNIDQLCLQSVRFENAFVQQALCGPSRTSFLTSRRPDSTHLYDVHSYWRDSVGNFTTLPQYFKENGYRTVSIGKVFHPGKASNFTDDYPYSWSEVPYHASTEKFKMSKVCPDISGEDRMNIVCPVDVRSQPEGTLPDIQATEYAIDWLGNHSQLITSSNRTSQPFFLAVGFHKPHIPLKYPREYLELHPISSIGLAPDPKFPTNLPLVAWNPWTDLRERDDVKRLKAFFPFGPLPPYFQRLIRQSYYAATSYMDDLFGKLIAELTNLGFLNNTIIVFVGDHGWSLGEHQEWSKYSNFEVATKVPLFIHVPGISDSYTFRKYGFHRTLVFKTNNSLKSINEAKSVSTELVELVDIFPTLADLAGLKAIPLCTNSSSPILCTEGSSLVPLIKTSVRRSSSTRWKKAVFSQYPRPAAYPQENSDQPKRTDIKIMGYTMRTEEYRYTEWIAFDSKRFVGNWSDVVGKELYVKERDAQEDYNVAGDKKYSSLAKQLSRELKAGWRNALPSKLEI